MNENMIENGNVVEIVNLAREFDWTTKALDGVTLNVPRGGVFGLVGENGAGKTTLFKHILGLFRAKTGIVRVFGLDPVKNPVEVLGRIGYLSRTETPKLIIPMSRKCAGPTVEFFPGRTGPFSIHGNT